MIGDQRDLREETVVSIANPAYDEKMQSRILEDIRTKTLAANTIQQTIVCSYERVSEWRTL
jgi:hypothetical protein